MGKSVSSINMCMDESRMKGKVEVGLNWGEHHVWARQVRNVFSKRFVRSPSRLSQSTEGAVGDAAFCCLRLSDGPAVSIDSRNMCKANLSPLLTLTTGAGVLDDWCWYWCWYRYWPRQRHGDTVEMH